MEMFVGSVQIDMDSQGKVQIFILFSGSYIVELIA